MKTEQLTDITQSAAAYIASAEGQPVVLAGIVGGEIWLLMPGDGFHLMDTRGMKEEVKPNGSATWTDEAGVCQLAIFPLILCDEFNRADTEAMIAKEREHYADDEGARWLKENIADAEREVAGRK